MRDALDGWAARLRRGRYNDGNEVDVSVLAHYVRLLRLVSGVHTSGLLELALGAETVREEGSLVRRLRADPAIKDFLEFLAHQEPVDRRTIWALIGEAVCPGVGRDRSLLQQVRELVRLEISCVPWKPGSISNAGESLLQARGVSCMSGRSGPTV